MIQKLETQKLFLIIAFSLIVKFALFGYALLEVPSAKFMPDTPTYLEPGINLMEKGVFATFDDEGHIKYETMRTPGYPIFTAFLSKTLKLSLDSIIIAQILLITFAGFVVYKSAYALDKNIALLATFIFLFDQPVTISALMLLSGGLYTVFMACFMYFSLRYLREYKAGVLILAALMLVIATFIRPVSYYLGICLAGGIIYALFRANIKKAVVHVLIFLIAFYAPLGAWHYRNYVKTGNADFTTIDNIDLRNMGLTHKYARDARSKDMKTGPFVYYVNHAARSTVQFFTIPGTLKYLRSKPLKAASKIYGYPWVIFWLIGLLFARYDKPSYRFLMSVILYSLLVSVVVIGLCVGSRFRAPIMPLISILSASGWVKIAGWLKKYHLSPRRC